MLSLKRIPTKNWHLSLSWLIVVLFVIVLLLEYSTPSGYVFGYLYSGPILLASTHLSRRMTLIVTTVACVLTILNIWVPNVPTVEASTIASRVIATFALIVTGVLSDRNQSFQQTVLQQQAKIQAQEKLASVREDFASTLTHDLKTPLLGAIETLNAFQQGRFGLVQSTQQKVLATIIRSHQSTLQLVEMLLDIYRNDTEGLKLHLFLVDLVELIEEVITTLRELAASRQINIALTYGESDFRKFLWVNGDPFQLQRVLANLLTNAINHSPRGGKVEVRMETTSAGQIIRIVDNGAGVNTAEIANLFERFYQGQSDRQAKGSGLGLYLSRQIVEAHGGTIWAENQNPRGAIFAFRLPVAPRPLIPSP
jgi:two-component system, NarL family, sensor kinase